LCPDFSKLSLVFEALLESASEAVSVKVYAGVVFAQRS
jgi:hypothetical protein